MLAVSSLLKQIVVDLVAGGAWMGAALSSDVPTEVSGMEARRDG
jgi:hypothetical protein